MDRCIYYDHVEVVWFMIVAWCQRLSAILVEIHAFFGTSFGTIPREICKLERYNLKWCWRRLILKAKYNWLFLYFVDQKALLFPEKQVSVWVAILIMILILICKTDYPKSKLVEQGKVLMHDCQFQCINYCKTLAYDFLLLIFHARFHQAACT